jgi:hypothetical protein
MVRDKNICFGIKKIINKKCGTNENSKTSVYLTNKKNTIFLSYLRLLFLKYYLVNVLWHKVSNKIE